MAIVGVALISAFAAICIQLVRLQVVEAPALSARADHQHHKTKRLPGERGTITDRNGVILAKNMDVPSISVDPTSLGSAKQTARALAQVLPMSRSQVMKRIKSGGRHFSWIYRKGDPTLANQVMDLNLKGVYRIPESRRFYPKGNLMGHILGFSGMDNQGLSGIERAYDNQLKGSEIRFVVERDALGRSVMPIGSRYVRPDHGADIQLTIDEVIQYHVEQQLDLAMKETGALTGTVVVMQPHTGEILAMAVRPDFDPNRIKKYRADRFRNRVISDPFEPGSTMKVFVAGLALESGVVTLDESIYCEKGRMPMRGGAMHDSHPHEQLTFAQVLSKSSNIGTAKVAMRLGKEKLHNGLTRFGFGQPTGLDMPGESSGILPQPDKWSARSLASIAIGQELAVTPLQIVRAASAVANGGWLMKPYVVRWIRQGDETIYTEPQRIRRVLSEDVAARLRQALVAVTEKGGTAPKGAVPGFDVAGKTGTAQKASTTRRGYAKGKYVASFLGMVPADNPALVMLVVLDEPQGRKYYGGSVAAPVFRAISERVLPYLDVQPRTHRTVVLTADAHTTPPPSQGDQPIL